MNDYLPREVADGLRMARTARRTSRMRVRVGDESFTILRYWDKGFSLAPEDAPRLRGLVDIYDGARHLTQALVLASGEEDGERLFEFKRATAVSDGPARDYERSETAPAGLIAQG